MDPVDRLVYVADSETNEVVVIDAITNSVLDSVIVDSGVWGMTTDGVNPRAYTANRNAGTVTLLGEPIPLPDEQRLALVALYDSTNGANWSDNSNWLVGDPCENNWYGLSCNLFGSTITGIELVNNHLAGSLPAEMEDLPNLQILTLSDNLLNGAIPIELASLNSLKTLDLGFNQFSGNIPSELGSLVNVETLKLSGNQLSGGIPSGFGSLANLLELRLQSNQLSGAIPDQLINLSALAPGLAPGLPHYFVVHRETDDHTSNQNDLLSDASTEVSATPEYVNEFIDFSTEFDFLTDPLSETPFTALDFNSGFDATQDALVTTMEASTFEPGHLVISSQNASWHNGKDDGVFLGKKVLATLSPK